MQGQTPPASRTHEARAPYRDDLVAFHIGWTDASGRLAAAVAVTLPRPMLCLTAARGYGRAVAAKHAAVALELPTSTRRTGDVLAP